MSEDRAVQARKAREVLNGCGWVFDKYRGEQMAVMLSDVPQAEREAAYVRARVVTEIQSELQGVVDNWEYDQKIERRREQVKENRHVN